MMNLVRVSVGRNRKNSEISSTHEKIAEAVNRGNEHHNNNNNDNKRVYIHTHNRTQKKYNLVKLYNYVLSI